MLISKSAYLENSDERPEERVEVLPLAFLRYWSEGQKWIGLLLAEFAPEQVHTQNAETQVRREGF